MSSSAAALSRETTAPSFRTAFLGFTASTAALCVLMVLFSL